MSSFVWFMEENYSLRNVSRVPNHDAKGQQSGKRSGTAIASPMFQLLKILHSRLQFLSNPLRARFGFKLYGPANANADLSRRRDFFSGLFDIE